jgi:hypothetical protein
MRIVLKIIKALAVLFISVTLVLFSAALIMQDRVADIILKSLNKSISTKFEFESVRLSFLRKFPKATLDLKNVLVHSSPGFNKDEFKGIDTDTLLAARSVFAEFDISDIYHGIYNIEKIGIRDGRLRLLSDSSGMVNYDIEVESDEESDSNFTLDLKKISVENLEACYKNLAIELLIEGIIENGNLKSRISGDEIDFSAVSAMQVTCFQLYNAKIENSILAEIDISLSSSDSLTTFRKGYLEFDDYRFSLEGSVYYNDMIDLSLTGENLDIEGIKKYFPEQLIAGISEYDPSGLMQVRSTIKGMMTRTSYPEINVWFTLKDGSVTLPENPLNLNGVALSGLFSNGPDHAPSTTVLTISDFRATLGSASYSGSLSLFNFDSLQGSLQLKGRIIPSELKGFFNIKEIASSNGSIDIDLKMKGALPGKEKFKFRDVIDLSPEAHAIFNNFTLGLKNDRFLIERVSGDLLLSDSLTAKNLNFGYRDHRIAVNGTFRKLPEWLAGMPVMLVVNGSVSSDRLVPEILLSSQAGSSAAGKPGKAFSLPDDIILDLYFNIDTFRIKQFKAEKISGTLSYKPGLVNFKSIRVNSLDGVISGTGFILQKPDKSFSARGSFDMKEVNINSAFKSFSNFGQDFIKAENISGRLSGSISMLLPADSLWKIDIKSISAEGKYTIADGALIDFEPVKQLGSFIEISELENIRFEELENDFFIRNNFLYIPQMEVRSSAADLSVSGKHSFDNDYEYHVKALLSEILSRKFRKPKPNTTEFGAVQDDGLGRTSILLKIENRGEDVRVSYDMKAAGSEIRNDIKAERKTLKTILNEEYGWFKEDTAAPEKPAPSKPRFRIAWEETDTASVEVEEEPEEPIENPLKNLFRKKKN